MLLFKPVRREILSSVAFTEVTHHITMSLV